MADGQGNYFLHTNIESGAVTEKMLRAAFTGSLEGHSYTPPVDIEATKVRVKAMGLEIVEKGSNTETLFGILGGVGPAPDPIEQRIRRELGVDDD